MHFNGKVWDYMRDYPGPFGGLKAPGTLYFYFFDAYVQKIVVTKLRRFFGQQKKTLISLIGPECSRDWVEEELCTLSLFGESNAYIIYQAEGLKNNVTDFLQENQAVLKERTFIFVFNKKTDFLNILKEYEDAQGAEFMPPDFWEWDKMFTLLAQEMRVKMTREVQEYVLNCLPSEGRDYVAALTQIRRFILEEGPLTLASAKKLISPHKIDQFSLAKIYSEKKKSEFFRTLVGVDMTYKDWIIFLAFMQNHLLKLAAPELLEKKKRLSQYDRCLIKNSGQWEVSEIARDTRFFGELQILAKKSDPYLMNMIQLASITA